VPHVFIKETYDILVAVDLVGHVEAARHWYLRLMQEVLVEADQQAGVVQEPHAADLVEVHEAATAVLGQEEAHRDQVVPAELDWEEVHRDLMLAREEQHVQAEALHTVWVGQEARGHVEHQVEEWHVHMDQEAGVVQVAWMASTDQDQAGEEHVVDQETLTGLEEVACLADEQDVQKEVEREGEVVGALFAVPEEVGVADSARSLGEVEEEGEHFGHAQHPHMAGQVQEVTQFLEKEHWGRETLLLEAY
jgi:hypothetical protein